MEVRVCKNCRRLFKYLYGPELCPECLILAGEKKEPSNQSERDSQELQSSQHGKTLNPMVKSMLKEEEEKFEQVRDYIMLNPSASVAQIAEVNDIPPTKLFEWIRDDRLEFSENSEYAWFTCEGCGAKIKSGRLCNRCKIR